MGQPQNRSPFSLTVIVGVTVAVLAAGGGTAWWAWNSLKSRETPIPTTSQPVPDKLQSSEQEQVQVYWLDARGTEVKLLPSRVTFEKSAKPKQVLETALVSLLEGPSNSTYTTTIPKGTKLLDLSLEKDGIHINLSPEFTTGGGSASMTGRLAQILYTATSLEPNTQVWLDVAGEPLEYLGGEGIMVDRPITRSIFQENFEAIVNSEG